MQFTIIATIEARKYVGGKNPLRFISYPCRQEEPAGNPARFFTSIKISNPPISNKNASSMPS